MTLHQRARTWATIALSASVLALSGCASMSSATPEEVVAKRANAYWQARITGQHEKAWAYSTPAYRKVRSVEQYRLQYGAGAAITTAETIKVSCASGEKCTARMKLAAKPAIVGLNLGTIETYVDETWLLEDGQWWRHQDL